MIQNEFVCGENGVGMSGGLEKIDVRVQLAGA
jgi:hypothetical protein